LGQKKPVFESESLEKVRKSSETEVSEHSEITENLEFVLFQTFRKYKKITLKLNFGNREKLVPTRKPTRMFGLKFRMQGLIEYHKTKATTNLSTVELGKINSRLEYTFFK